MPIHPIMFARHLAFLVVTGSFGFSLVPCAAQDGGEVTLQFLSFPKSIDPKPVELLIGDTKTMEVAIPSNELSGTYKVKRMANWSVGKTATDKDGKTVFKSFGQATALASSSQLILLVRKGADNAEGMTVVPLENEIANFGGGKFLFVNAAKLDIAGDVGGEKFVIKPGQHTIIKPKPGENGRTFLAVFYFRKDDETKPFFSSKWPTSESARGLIFFYQDPETQGIRMHSIRDFF